MYKDFFMDLSECCWQEVYNFYCYSVYLLVKKYFRLILLLLVLRLSMLYKCFRYIERMDKVIVIIEQVLVY